MEPDGSPWTVGRGAMRVGTYILSLAAMQLIDVGPSESTEKVNLFNVIRMPMASAWILLMMVLMVGGACMLPCVHDASRDSGTKLFAYTAVVSIHSSPPGQPVRS